MNEQDKVELDQLKKILSRCVNIANMQCEIFGGIYYEVMSRL